jgi:hypothetical protein
MASMHVRGPFFQLRIHNVVQGSCGPSHCGYLQHSFFAIFAELHPFVNGCTHGLTFSAWSKL